MAVLQKRIEKCVGSGIIGLAWITHKTRAVPAVEQIAGAFELVSIRTCCKDIIRAVMGDDESDSGFGLGLPTSGGSSTIT